MCSWHRAHGTSDSNGGNRDRDRHGGRSKQKACSGDGRRLTQVLVQHFPKQHGAVLRLHCARPAIDERGPRSPESVSSRNSSDRVSGRRRFRMESDAFCRALRASPSTGPRRGIPAAWGVSTDWSNPLETALFCLEQICPKDRFDKGTRRTEVHYGVDEWN